MTALAPQAQLGSARQLVGTEATLDNFRRAVEEMFTQATTQAAGAGSPNTNNKWQAVIYICTHAELVSKAGISKPYLVLHNSREGEYITTALLFRDLLGLLQECKGGAYRVLLIADVCVADEFEPRLVRYDFADAVPHLGVIMACSGSKGTAISNSAWSGSALCEALKKGLNGYAFPNGSSELTLPKLGDYLKKEVQQLTGLRQLPKLFSGRSGRWTEEPLLARRGFVPRQPPTPQLLVHAAAGTDVFVDGTPAGRVAATPHRIDGLTTGWHRVRAISPLRPGAGVRRDEELEVDLAGDVTEARFDEDRPDEVGIVSDTLPSSTVLYRPVTLYQNSPVVIEEDCADNSFNGNCTRLTINLSDAGSNGVHWLPDGEVAGTRAGLNIEATLAPKAGERVLLRWYAQTDRPCAVQFKVGGAAREPHKDSILPALPTRYETLGSQWKLFELDVTGRDLASVITGFCVVTNRIHNPGTSQVQLRIDEVRFVRRSSQ